MTAVAYGLAMPSTRGLLTPAPYCAQSIAFFQRLATQPSAARKTLYDVMIRALVAAGIWAKLDLLYVFAAPDQATALTNLVAAGYAATAVGALAFSADRGFTGNGLTSYVNTNWKPSLGVQFQQNSAHFSLWSLTNRSAANAAQGLYASSGDAVIFPYYPGSIAVGRCNSTTSTVAASGDSLGFYVQNTSASNAQQLYRNGSLIGSSSAATSAPLANNLYLAGCNGAAGSLDQISAASTGGSLASSEQAAFYTVLHAFLQNIAGVA